MLTEALSHPYHLHVTKMTLLLQQNIYLYVDISHKLIQCVL